MHNPFRRAARNGAPDMRVTAPPSAETPMPKPHTVEVDNIHLLAAAPDLLAALELWQSTLEILDVDEGFHTIYVPSETVDAMASAIAKARGTEPDHDPPDSRNPYAKPYDEALIGHLRNNPPRNE